VRQSWYPAHGCRIKSAAILDDEHAGSRRRSRTDDAAEAVPGAQVMDAVEGPAARWSVPVRKPR
jgi:hypothetical protein